MNLDRNTPAPRTFTEEFPVPKDAQAGFLAIELELSRLKVIDASATLKSKDGSAASLLTKVHGGGRRITISPVAESPDELYFPQGAVVVLTVTKIGDAPEFVRTVWDDGSSRDELIEGSLFASDIEVFDTRSGDINRERSLVVDGSAEAKRLDFEAFLTDWDRETYISDEVVPSWRRVDADGGSLPEPERAARYDAVEELSVTLFKRAKARGQGLDHAPYPELQVNDEQLALIGDLHEQLFHRHFGEFNRESIANLGRQFLSFATGAFERVVKAKGGAYQNGRPNGAILVTLAELSALLKESPARADYWSDLHPWFVGCIAAYAKSHYYSSRAMMGDYGLGSLVPDRRIGDLEVSVLEGHLARFVAEGSLDRHWKNLLTLLAPGSFQRDGNEDDGPFRDLGDYFGAPEA